MKYYKKLVPDTKLLLSNGRYYPFERVDASIGLTATDNAWLQSELAEAIKGDRGGVVEINKDQYDEIKKKALEQPSPPISREEISLHSLSAARSHIAPQEVAVALNEPSMAVRSTRGGEFTKPKSVRR